jgi:hypothetical protein
MSPASSPGLRVAIWCARCQRASFWTIHACSLGDFSTLTFLVSHEVTAGVERTRYPFRCIGEEHSPPKRHRVEPRKNMRLTGQVAIGESRGSLFDRATSGEQEAQTEAELKGWSGRLYVDSRRSSEGARRGFRTRGAGGAFAQSHLEEADGPPPRRRGGPRKGSSGVHTGLARQLPLRPRRTG